MEEENKQEAEVIKLPTAEDVESDLFDENPTTGNVPEDVEITITQEPEFSDEELAEIGEWEVAVAQEYHASVVELLNYFEYGHLPTTLQAISLPFHRLAHEMAAKLRGPELTVGLRKLLEAKDCMVRAAL